MVKCIGINDQAKSELLVSYAIIIKQIERYNKDVIYFDLYFDEDKLYAKVDSSSNEAPIKYKDLKKINETNDIVFFTSNAGFKIYFEKKNASNC